MKLPVSFFIALAAFFVAVASMEAQLLPTATPGLSPTETWIVERVTNGETADLTKQFANEKDRQLDAKFLISLLTGGLKGVTPHRNGVRISGARFRETVDLTNATIVGEVWLEHCQFDEDAIFIGTTFPGLVSFEHTLFRKTVNLNQVRIGGDLTFQAAVFEGAASFVAANIARSFYINKTQFKNTEESANFSDLKAARAILIDATFEGPVNFISADIAGTFEAEGAQFRNRKQGATFNSLEVRDSAFFHRCVFEGTADFILADFGANFEAHDVQFKNREQGAYFYGMKVGRIAFFERAVFEGRAEFDAAEITASFEASEAQFRNETETARFGMKCGMQGVFRGVTFAGPVSFQNSSFIDLVIGDMKPDAAAIPQLDLSQGSIKRHLSIRKIRIQHLAAPWLHVEGPANFTDIVVEQSADLSHGDFSTLDLSRSVWPKNAGGFHLQGMNYKYIRAAEKSSESHAALKKLADQSAYSADVYRSLEMFFLRQGYSADANAVFIAGKQRERRENLNGPAWLGNLLLDKLVGYGRHPWQAGIPCAFFVILGCFLFAPSKMELRKTEDSKRVYNPFWYSLSLFVPFVDLQSHSVWKPKDDCWFLRHYMRVHTLFGWILIPILLAAISGLIK